MTSPTHVTLINNKLRVHIACHGAELRSLQSSEHGTEYLWNADPKWWNRSAPFLFPIVGKIKDDVYEHHGSTYSLKQHGFVRDTVFSVVHSTDSEVSFMCSDTPETQKMYPFTFELYIHYKLIEATLFCTAELVNPYNTPLPYCFGTHPAFLLGEGEHEPFITSSESLPATFIQLQGGLLTQQNQYEHEDRSIRITPETFTNDALVFPSYAPKQFTLSRRDGTEVLVQGTGFTDSALWSKQDAPFVCIEYWNGHADSIDTPRDILLKKQFKTLLAQKTQYELTIGVQGL